MSVFRRDEGGQSVVLIAVSLPLILSLLLLVIDGGRLYVERERIRNAAQLAAEAAVSYAADQPGRSDPGNTQALRIGNEAIDRNLRGESWTAEMKAPFRTDIPEFNVRVRITKEFRASIAAVRFLISADAAAKLGGTDSALLATPQPRTPPPVSPSPTATATATAGATTAATPTPRITPTPSPSVSLTVQGYYRTRSQVPPSARIYYDVRCGTPALGCFNPIAFRWTSPYDSRPGVSTIRYRDGIPAIPTEQFDTPGSTHTYRQDWVQGSGSSRTVIASISARVVWPLATAAYVSTPYSVTVTQ